MCVCETISLLLHNLKKLKIKILKLNAKVICTFIQYCQNIIFVYLIELQ